MVFPRARFQRTLLLVFALLLGSCSDDAEDFGSEAHKKTRAFAPSPRVEIRPVIGDIPRGFEIDGSFSCIQYRDLGNGKTSIKAEGGRLTNVSGQEQMLGVRFSAISGDQPYDLKQAFLLAPNQSLTFFSMLPRETKPPLQSCELSFIVDPPPDYEGATGSSRIVERSE